MKYSDAFPSKYMKADDLQGTDRIVTIHSVDFEDFTDPKTRRTETKPVLRFREKAAKDLVLNRTNFKTLSILLGDETDNWEGQQIVLYSTRVESFGEMVDAIRIRERKPAAAAAVKPAPQPQPQPQQADAGVGMDAVPF